MRRRYWRVSLWFVVSGCAMPADTPRNDAPGDAFELPTSDVSFRISADDLRSIRPAFDPNALEQLLQRINPAYRAELLSEFTFGSQGGAGSSQELVVPASGRVERVGFTTSLASPNLDALLARVWSPYWATVSDADLQATIQSPVPGLAEARTTRLSNGNSAERFK